MSRASESRNRKIRQMNAWLESWLRGQGFRFMDNWIFMDYWIIMDNHHPWGRGDLFKKDRLHAKLQKNLKRNACSEEDCKS